MQRPAAVATPEPLDDEPDHRSLFHGFLGACLRGLYPPIAPSVKLSLPSMIAPASFNLVITVASYSGTKFSKTAVPAIVLTPSVKHKSFTPIGIPCKGPKFSTEIPDIS